MSRRLNAFSFESQLVALESHIGMEHGLCHYELHRGPFGSLNGGPNPAYRLSRVLLFPLFSLISKGSTPTFQLWKYSICRIALFRLPAVVVMTEHKLDGISRGGDEHGEHPHNTSRLSDRASEACRVGRCHLGIAPL